MAFHVEYLKFDFNPANVNFNEKMYNELKNRINNGDEINSKELFNRYFKIYQYHTIPDEFKSIIFAYIFGSIVILGLIFYLGYDHIDFSGLIKVLLIILILNVFISEYILLSKFH